MKSRNSACKCSRCKRQAVIELRYSGDYFLCKNCFLELFEKRVKKSIRLNRLFEKDDRIAIALSGGKDSATVLYLMHQIYKKIPKSALTAISIDQETGESRKECLDAARSLCKKLGVKHYVYSMKKRYGVEAPDDRDYAAFRNDLLNLKAVELGITKLVTGHDMDDEVEKSLTKLMRGDVGKMAGTGKVEKESGNRPSISLIKPLRNCPENEVRLYAELKDIGHERGRCPYPENAFRQTVRKMIEEIEEKHPGSKFQMLKSTDKLIELLGKEKDF